MKAKKNRKGGGPTTPNPAPTTDCRTVARLSSDLERLGDLDPTEDTQRRHSAASDHSGQTIPLLQSTGAPADNSAGGGNMLQVPGANNNNGTAEKRRTKSVSDVDDPESTSPEVTSQHTSRSRSGSGASKRRSSFGFHRSRSGSRKGSRKRKGSTSSRTSGRSSS